MNRWVDDMERKAMDSFKQHSNVHVSVGVLSAEELEVRIDGLISDRRSYFGVHLYGIS